MESMNRHMLRKRSYRRPRCQFPGGGGLRSFLKSVLPVCLLLICSSLIYADDIRGRLYLSGYFSEDSEQRSLSILTSRLKLSSPEQGKPGFSFNLDGRLRTPLSGEDLHSDIPEYRFDEIWLGYTFPGLRWNLIAGRQYIREMYNTQIDGLNARYSFGNGWSAGIFGGLAPDKYDNSFNTKFTSAGIYGSLVREKYSVSFGLENLLYKGKTDRQYASLRLNSALSESSNISVISSVSMNQVTHGPEVENFNANYHYDYSRDLRFDIFYDYYRAVKYYESSKRLYDIFDRDYYIDDNPQSRTGIRAAYRVSEDLSLFASAAYQMRKSDDGDALRLSGGFRRDDLFGLDVSGSYTYVDNFTSKSSEFSAEISRNIADKVDISVYASHEREKLAIENGFTSGIFTYGTSVFWNINRNYYASLTVERSEENDYRNTSVFTQVGIRF